MLMFRFWSSESRGSDTTVPADQPMFEFAKPLQPWLSSEHILIPTPTESPQHPSLGSAAIASPSASLKRSRAADDDGDAVRPSPAKQAALSPAIAKSAPQPSLPQSAPPPPVLAQPVPAQPDLERARDIIEEQLGLEILLKHNELRLIDQELAKCQIALEQLRRCHLIPYPINVPTPEQMLNITNGTGAALQPRSGEKLPQWAPPFGVTDGPYARHYAKWLIPDPKFDGIVPQTPAPSDVSHGRSTRNSFALFNDLGASQNRGRPVRGNAGQKLHSLSSGYAQPKDKSGPCTLKRSDGKIVKLVCIDCHRENFSSTQGFINHCRIAHKRDFKSHEEAAVACGHPFEVADVAGVATEEKHEKQEKPTTHIAPPPGLVHPFARQNAMSESEACFSVVRRIKESMELYKQGKLDGFVSKKSVPAKPDNSKTTGKPQEAFSPSADSPHLSRLLQSRGFSGNLSTLISEAKEKVDLDQFLSPEDEEPEEASAIGAHATVGTSDPSASSAPVRMRVPARVVKSPALGTTRPSSSKCAPPPLAPTPAPLATPMATPTPQATSSSSQEPVVDEDMLDAADLSPNTAVSNNAPSLVSDDGEYDDSVADSESDSDEVGLDARSMSDVEEIEIEDDHTGARGLRHHRGSTVSGPGTTVRLGADDSKHVTFVTPIKERVNGKHKRGRRVGTGANP
ncbi:hypothetical protein GGR56DRAFT_593384 [Xylariaceae sp. FL0804]|nr:hypothetical protein GGR56DRAFT_593384 [Xylariaceae sp. FL0804]